MGFTAFYVDKDSGNASNLNAGSTTGAPVTYAGGTFVRATGVYTVASGDPTTDITVGDFVSIYTTAGATQPGLVARVTARTSTTITVSTTILSGATANVSETANAATLKMGGPWAGMSAGVAFPFGFVTQLLVNASSEPTKVYFKKPASGGYDVTAAMTQSSGVYFKGYETTVEDDGIVKINGIAAATANPFELLSIGAEGVTLENFWFDGNHDTVTDFGSGVGTGDAIIDIDSRALYVRRCIFTKAWRAAIRAGGGGGGGGHVFEECLFYDNQRDDASNFGHVVINEECTFNYCAFIGSGLNHHAARDGQDSHAVRIATDRGEPATFNFCLFLESDANGAEFASDSAAVFNNCIFWGNGIASGDCIDLATAGTNPHRIVLNNCVLGNTATGYGVRGDADLRWGPYLNKCAFYSNASGNTTLVNADFMRGTITLTADPFVDADNYDFTPNDDPGGGALLKNAGWRDFVGFPTTFTTLFRTYQNVGTVQHEESAAVAGGPIPIMRVNGGPIVII